MGALVNDGVGGSVLYGSRLLKISGSGAGSYVAEDLELTRTVEVVEVYNEVGEPKAQIIIPRWVTLTATLQLSGSAGGIPGQGSNFSEIFSGSAETFYITEISQPESQTSDKKVRISARKKIG